MPAPNLYEELKTALNDFKTFLTEKKDVIKPAIAPLDQLTGGRITELLTLLIELLGKLHDEIDKLDPAAVPGLSDVTAFTQSVKTLLETSKNLLPNQASDIDQVLGVVDVVTGLPTLSDIKGEILDLINDIKDLLTDLKS